MSEQLLPQDIKLDLSLPPIVEMKYTGSDTPNALLSGYLGLKHHTNNTKSVPIEEGTKPSVQFLIAKAYSDSEERRTINPGSRFPPIGQKKFMGNKVNPRKISNYLKIEPVHHSENEEEKKRSLNYTNVLALILGLAILYNQLAHPQVTVDSSQIPSNDTVGFEPGEMVYKFLGFNRELIPKDVFEETYSHTHPISSTISYSNGK